MNLYPISREPGITWTLFCDDYIAFASSKYIGPYVALVLNEVRRVFVETFGADTVNSHPVLGVLPAVDCPQTGRIHKIIFLSSRGTYCNQHIYQFAHELCHFMVPDEVCQKYRWFEETLCQMMSWYAMERIYESRSDHPLPNFDECYDNMPRYIKKDQDDRLSLGGASLSSFICANLQHLQKDCYDRRMNRAIGYELYPLFLDNPGLWKIVPSLHTLTDDMLLHDALDCLRRTLNREESGWDQFIKRLLE